MQLFKITLLPLPFHEGKSVLISNKLSHIQTWKFFYHIHTFPILRTIFLLIPSCVIFTNTHIYYKQLIFFTVLNDFLFTQNLRCKLNIIKIKSKGLRKFYIDV